MEVTSLFPFLARGSYNNRILQLITSLNVISRSHHCGRAVQDDDTSAAEAVCLPSGHLPQQTSSRIALLVIACLLVGLSACTGTANNTNQGGGGTTALAISGASVADTATSATVSWNTNMAATGQVNYGTTTAYGSTAGAPTMQTSQSVPLSSLTCATTYHYQILSTAGAGNSASTSDATFATAACASISGVSVSTTAVSATIAWTTSVAANSQVNYGTTTAYGSTASDANMLTNHSLTLNSLTCGTTYHYQITSVVGTGDTSTTTDATFTTASCPTISGVSVSTTAVSAALSWTTSVAANSQVNYGTTATYGSAVTDPNLLTSHSLNLTSLTCNTTYHFQITSAVSAGDSATTSDATFTTASCQIEISGLTASTGATSATLTWTTNVTGSSGVSYGATSQYGYSSNDPTLVTNHSVTLNSLACNATYHYEVSSAVSAGNSTTTSDATFTTGACGGPVSDDFSSPVLNPMWTFYAQCCGSVRMNGTDAILVVPGVTSHNIFGVNQAVGLLQNVADVDFQVEVKFDSIVTQGDQVEGILVQQDAQDFIWFGVYNDGTTPRIYSNVTIGGTPTLEYNNPIAIAAGTTSFWMRVQRTGSAWTQSWSTDGVNYTSQAVNQTLVVSAIGPAAGNDNDASSDPAPNFNGAVDYFFNTASPISPTDGGMPQPPNQPVFSMWYGDNETFGQIGIPQRWVNVLGNVSAPSGIASASFTLNGGPAQFLRVGPNGTRLADTGDFNVEIDHALLNPGANTVVITATDNLGNVASHTVTVNWANTGQVWPLPYSIDWSTVQNISDVAQVMDGQWAIQPDGSVRTMQTAYDRVILIGDETWTDYQVTAEVTFNAFDCFDFGGGILVGWSGTTYSSTALQPDQPTSGHPFFGDGEYSTAGGPPSNAALDIYANSPSYPETTLIRDTSGWMVTLGVKYMFKFAVQRNANNTASLLSLKVWPAGTAEPANWTLQANTDPSTGSFMIICYRADVSFGNINVVALP